MITRLYNNKTDYATLTAWWTAHDWLVVPEHALPPLGLVVESTAGSPIAAVFLYQTDSSICWVEWLVADPNTDKHLRDVAINIVLNDIADIARDYGYKAIFTSSAFSQLTDRLSEKHEFIVTDKNMTHLIKSL